MEAVKCIRERRSIRKFDGRKVPHDLIKEIVADAVYAPSWKNTQITRYVVIENEDIKKKIGEECVLDFTFNTKTIVNAPQLVAVTYVKGRSGYEKDGSFTTSKGDRWQNFDAGVATQTFCLAAHDKGIGTVILGVFDDAKVAEAMNLDEGQEVAALVAMGYPAVDAPAAPKRKEAEDILSYL